MNFTVDCDKWRCGESLSSNENKQLGQGKTALLNDKGYMCCLGHCSLQLGIEPELLDGKSEPIDLYSFLNRNNSIPKGFDIFADSNNLDNTSLSWDAMEINDDSSTTIQEKADKLRKLFKKHGHSITFKNINKYTK